MRSPIPVSLGFFLVSGIVYLLQLRPETGVFLMMLAAPVWSVALINAGFIGIAIEAAIGFTRRFWLVLPVLWFGGYAAFAAADRLAMTHEARRLHADAATAGLPSSRRPTLVIHDPDSYIGGEIATRLVTGTDASVVYVAAADGTTAYRFAPLSYCGGSGSRMAGATIRQRTPMGIATRVDGACVLSVAENAPASAVQVFLEKERVPDTAGRRYVLVMGSPDGPRIPLRAGDKGPLTWFPMPILGCALNSAMNRWECMARFAREPAEVSGRGGESGQAASALAAAFALAPRTADTPADPVAEARLAALAEEGTHKALATLDLMLEQPLQSEHSFIDVSSLLSRPSAFRDRAPAMAAAVRRHMGDEGAAGTLSAFQILLAGLPEADFATVRPVLSDVYRPGAELPRGLTVRALMTRLGVSGRRMPGSRDVYRIEAVHRTDPG